MAPQFAEAARKELEASPLELVVCQVRFPPVLGLAHGQAPEAFYQKIPEYPVVTSKQTPNVEVMLESGTQRITTTPLWAFEDEEGHWTVSLAPTFIALETRHYQRFTDFISNFEKILGVAREVYGLKVRDRIGLRYVDRISRTRCPNISEDWTTRIEPKLLGLRTLLEDDERINATSEFRIARGDRILAIRAMFAAAGFPGVSEDELVLDFDCYTEKRGKFDDCSARLEEYRAAGYQAFRWAMGTLIDSFPEVPKNG